MNKLITFLNSMDRASQEDFAKRCKTTIGYLRKAAYKNQEIGAEISVNIERESGNVVSRKDLHPDTFIDKWPELASKQKKSA